MGAADPASSSQVNVDPEDLIPKLPRPRDLQPFPTCQALVSRQCGLWGAKASEGLVFTALPFLCRSTGATTTLSAASASPQMANGWHQVGAQWGSSPGGVVWAGLEGQVLRACLCVQVQMMAQCDSGRWSLPAA